MHFDRRSAWVGFLVAVALFLLSHGVHGVWVARSRAVAAVFLVAALIILCMPTRARRDDGAAAGLDALSGSSFIRGSADGAIVEDNHSTAVTFINGSARDAAIRDNKHEPPSLDPGV